MASIVHKPFQLMSVLVTLYSVCKSRLYCLQFQHTRLCSVLIS